MPQHIQFNLGNEADHRCLDLSVFAPIPNEGQPHDKVCLAIYSGPFILNARMTSADARRIAAALVTVADEIDPPKAAPAPTIAEAARHLLRVADQIEEDSTDSLLRPTTPAETCGDCHGEGTKPGDVDFEGRPTVMDCPRCNGVGKLYPTARIEAGQQVAKFDGTKPALEITPPPPTYCTECDRDVASCDIQGGSTHALACSKHAPF